MGDLIFDDGFRANVGIVIFNKDRKVFYDLEISINAP